MKHQGFHLWSNGNITEEAETWHQVMIYPLKCSKCLTHWELAIKTCYLCITHQSNCPICTQQTLICAGGSVACQALSLVSCSRSILERGKCPNISIHWDANFDNPLTCFAGIRAQGMECTSPPYDYTLSNNCMANHCPKHCFAHWAPWKRDPRCKLDFSKG